MQLPQLPTAPQSGVRERQDSVRDNEVEIELQPLSPYLSGFRLWIVGPWVSRVFWLGEGTAARVLRASLGPV